MINFLKSLVNSAPVDFIELRIEKIITQKISTIIKNGSIVEIIPFANLDIGCSFRINHKNRRFFISSPLSEINDIKHITNTFYSALQIAKKTREQKSATLLIEPKKNIQTIHENALNGFNLRIEDIKEVARDSKFRTDIITKDLSKTKYYVNNRNVFYRTHDRSYSIDLTIKNQNWFYNQGVGRTDRPLTSNEVRENLDILNAKGTPINRVLCPNGNVTVVLDPQITGLFIHEVLGHLLEADNRRLGNRDWLEIGRRVAPDFITVVDNPNLKGEYGSYKIDDEGIQAREVHLLKNGVLYGMLHSRDTALSEGTVTTGHARAINWRYPPIVRMSNTYLMNGNLPFEQLISDIKEGVYLFGPRGGMLFGKKFFISSQGGRMIRNGMLREYTYPITITGELQEALFKIKGIGNDFLIFGGGEGGCGKLGQFPLPVSSGGPSIKIEGIQVVDFL
ncbi:TldD/PmbA family protein [Paenibacillus thiaminolyticus]|uniref:TldD/PmbA family protein n=1 Tax=Paenibacillus thiaminolyticus TaxID=49283 RepID=UPI0013F5B89E|nr:TldD/PmbA family protein [Paenibacillus thiaminolyticus]MDG0874595.1 TldD/PmbA family protein [Paenibacillus thiaminolyticus]NGP57610.1 TldD/PmbA family protein [Paenibacillus thiaminolyticus]